MKKDDFITTCFSSDKFVVPVVNEIDKLTKIWDKTIKDFKKDFGPQTKLAKKNREIIRIKFVFISTTLKIWNKIFSSL